MPRSRDAWGVAAAFISSAAYMLLGPVAQLSPSGYSRILAPLVEESTKATFIAYLIVRRRIGFPVDAAQLGFAVGGFAIIENLQYLRVLSDAGFVLWCVRGLGTAMLHGAATAVFAMLSQTAADRHRERLVVAFVPGWIAAVLIHAAFNLVPVSRVAVTGNAAGRAAPDRPLGLPAE